MYDFYSLLKKSYKRIGLPIPNIDYFENLQIELKDSCKILFLTDPYDNSILVSSLSLVYKDVLIAYYIGRLNSKEVLKKNPIDYFNWKRLLWAKKRGVKLFNWLGAGKPNIESGVRDYKKTFCQNVVNYGRFQCIHKPLLFFVGKILLKLFKLRKIL